MRFARGGAVLVSLAAMSLAGCVIDIDADDDASDRVEAVPPPPVPMICDAAPAQGYVGRKATQSIGEAIQQASGSRSLRWGAPNSAWTKDYREDRVNVRYDNAMIIETITCG